MEKSNILRVTITVEKIGEDGTVLDSMSTPITAYGYPVTDRPLVIGGRKPDCQHKAQTHDLCRAMDIAQDAIFSQYLEGYSTSLYEDDSFICSICLSSPLYGQEIQE